KFVSNLLQRNNRVFDRIVQKTRHDNWRVNVKIGQNGGSREAVSHVRLARPATLALVCFLRKGGGPPYDRRVILRKVLMNLFDQPLNFCHMTPTRSWPLFVGGLYIIALLQRRFKPER